MIRQGTTTVEAKSGYGITETGEVRTLRTHAALNERMRNVVSTFLSASALPHSFPLGLDDYADWLSTHLLPLIRRRKLAEFVEVRCEEGYFSLDQAGRLLSFA